jgi:uncharacterized protein (UPF0548 family)
MIIARQAALDLSYPEVGATAGEMPAGYRHDRWCADLGEFSQDSFDRAAAALRSWSVQRGAGMTVVPGQEVRDGAVFALVFRPFGGFVTAAGRVVYVVDEPGRSGFAYGTLPGHPEQGEESFLVVRRDGRLWFEITAFSRPRHPLARLGWPVTRALQVQVTRRYVGAMRAAVRSEPGEDQAMGDGRPRRAR